MCGCPDQSLPRSVFFSSTVIPLAEAAALAEEPAPAAAEPVVVVAEEEADKELFEPALPEVTVEPVLVPPSEAAVSGLDTSSVDEIGGVTLAAVGDVAEAAETPADEPALAAPPPSAEFVASELLTPLVAAPDALPDDPLDAAAKSITAGPAAPPAGYTAVSTTAGSGYKNDRFET